MVLDVRGWLGKIGIIFQLKFVKLNLNYFSAFQKMDNSWFLIQCLDPDLYKPRYFSMKIRYGTSEFSSEPDRQLTKLIVNQ